MTNMMATNPKVTKHSSDVSHFRFQNLLEPPQLAATLTILCKRDAFDPKQTHQRRKMVSS